MVDVEDLFHNIVAHFHKDKVVPTVSVCILGFE